MAEDIIKKYKERMKKDLVQPKSKKVNPNKTSNLTKSKSSKLGTGSTSSGSKNPTTLKNIKEKKSLVSGMNFKDMYNTYIAGSKTKINPKKKTTSIKTTTMSDKYKTQMSKIAKNEKGVKSSQSDAQKYSKLKSDATKKLMNKNKSTVVKKKTPIVTKEQLKKSGLSLRDYMNMLQGKTRKDYNDVIKVARKKRARGAIT
jgi:hypothetical protein